MIARIRNYILTGLLVILPLIISVALLWWLFVKVTDMVLGILPQALKTSPLMIIIVRLLIPIVLLVFLAFVGMIARLVFIRKVFGLGEKILIKIPLFNKVYLALKQISKAFLSSENTVFRRVVMIEYPRKGLYSIGFVTSKAKSEVQEKTRHEVLNVFIPTTPNPTSGVLVFADTRDVIELNMSVEEGLKLVISGGTVSPPYNKQATGGGKMVVE